MENNVLKLSTIKLLKRVIIVLWVLFLIISSRFSFLCKQNGNIY